MIKLATELTLGYVEHSCLHLMKGPRTIILPCLDTFPTELAFVDKTEAAQGMILAYLFHLARETAGG